MLEISYFEFQVGWGGHSFPQFMSFVALDLAPCSGEWLLVQKIFKHIEIAVTGLSQAFFKFADQRAYRSKLGAQ